MSVTPARESKETSKKYLAFMCSHTHWDREWYGSFHQYRYRLVRLMDRLMDLLENDPEYRCFNFDGQTVVIEDYLEVKPEQRPRLEKLIREGRIVIGPWYILPDEWLVSGEAWVRNLLRARMICHEFGVEGSKAGYLPDMFGHISQIPQLLRGFGMDSAIFWRGLSGEQWKSELWWESPDGSRVLAFHLPEYTGYCNAAFFYGSLPPEARTIKPEPDGRTMVSKDPELASDVLRAIADRAIAASRSGVLLFMNGVDHMEPHPELSEIMRLANQKLEDVEIRHATFEEFLETLKERTPKDLQVIRGEQRSTAVARESGAIVLPNILSSRIYLKQANVTCQTLLERWTEPFASAAAWCAGAQYPEGFIRTAWKWLLRNHPHDSIGGCSIDTVHRTMETRFDWAQDIASTLLDASLYSLAENIRTEELDDSQLGFFLFNPLNWEVSDLVIANIDLDHEWLTKHGVTLGDNVYNSIRNLKLTDWQGQPVAFEVLDVENYTQHRPWVESFAPLYGAVRFKVALWAEKLPALGYKGYRVGMVQKPRRLPNRHSIANLAKLENEHLTVEVNPNGTLRISGAALGGEVLDNLHYFEDGGDNGDGYTYSPPRHDALVTSLCASNVQVTRLETYGHGMQALAIDYTLELPAGLTHERQHRLSETVALKMRSVLRLGEHSKRLDIETTLTNTAKDHRLRVCFDVPKAGNSHFAEMQFDVVERSNTIVQPSEEVWCEDMPIEQPQQGLVSYGKLALASFGLPEYEMVEGEPSILKLTLMRAANYLGAGANANTICGGAGPYLETPDQQMIGRSLTFRYAIIPHEGDFAKAQVQRQAYQHNALWRGATTARHGGSLPAEELSFLTLEGEGIVLSSLKKAEDSPSDYVVRFWNAGQTPSTATVGWLRCPAAAYVSNLAEECLEPLSLDKDAKATVSVRPKQVVTVRFKLES